MSKSSYRDLELWQKARVLASTTYRMTAGFGRSEMFGLTQQMRRAAISVPSNIAEGHGRHTDPERTHFLLVARGSLYELETQALIAGDLEFIDNTEAESLVERIMEVARLLNGLIRHYTTG
jgi:four helix bundle protein